MITEDLDRVRVALTQPLTSRPDYGTGDAAVPRGDDSEGHGMALEKILEELKDISDELR